MRNGKETKQNGAKKAMQNEVKQKEAKHSEKSKA